jgi:hypothetical protein
VERPCPAPRAAVRVGAGEAGEELGPPGLDDRRWGVAWRYSERFAAPGELLLAVAIGEEPVGAHPGEAVRQHVEQKATEKLVGVQAHRPEAVAVGPKRVPAAVRQAKPGDGGR